MIKLREKDILFTGINLIFFFCTASYILMSILGLQAIGMAEGTNNFTGFVVVHTFSCLAFQVVAILVILFDVWWCWKGLRKIYRDYRKDTL